MGLLKKCMDFYLKKTSLIKYAKIIGVSIGENCKLNGSPDWGSEPWLISLGNHSEVSFDCAFVTHDGATWVFRKEERYKDIIKFGRIKIGDDCFIGARSTILPGVTIGNRSIVASGAVVAKSIPSGEVWGGVPAHFIMTVDEYAEKCLANTPKYDPIRLQTHKKDETLKITK